MTPCAHLVNHLVLQDVAREIADLSQGRVGHLRIGAGPTVAEDMLPPACTALLKDAPKLSFKLRSVASSDLLDFTSRHVVRQAAKRYRLAVLPAKELESTFRRSVGVIYREGGYLSPAARRFIEILKTTAKEITTE